MSADPMAMTTSDHTPLAGLAHDTRGGISNPVLGMILFITSEVMFFAGLFAAYFTIRAGSTNGWPPPEFVGKLNMLPFVLPATILLIASSFTCQLAVNGIRRGDHRALVRSIAVTVILGVIFLVLQGIDYSHLYGDGVRLDAGTFGTTYYTLTGFHGAHVLGGVIMLSVVLYRAGSGQFSRAHHDMVEAVSFYWHFVDVVWILLFSTLYLLPATP